MSKKLLCIIMFLLGGLIAQSTVGMQQSGHSPVCDMNILSCELSDPFDIENCQKKRDIEHKECIKREAAKKAALQEQMVMQRAAQEYVQNMHPKLGAFDMYAQR